MELDTFYGPFDVPDWSDDLIIDTLRSDGEWAVRESRIVAHLLPDGAVLWDCGAFLGTFTLGVARHSVLASAVTIEANADLIPHLASNISRLAACPSVVVHAAIAAKSAVLCLRADGDASNNQGAQAYDYAPHYTTGAVVSQTLRKLRAQHGDYTALKLDVEGMEVEALKGDYAFIAETSPILWVECNESLQSLQILSAMKSLGYNPVYIAFPAFRRDNFLGATDVRYPLAYEAALFAAPENVLTSIDWQSDVFSDVIVRPVGSHVELRKALFDTPRWGQLDWEALSRAELLGRLTRTVRGQTLTDFLI